MQSFYVNTQYPQSTPLFNTIGYQTQYCIQQNMIENYQLQQSIQNTQFMQSQMICPQQMLQQNQYQGFTEAVNFVSQYQNSDDNIYQNEYQGEYDQMTSSKGSYSSSTYQDEKLEYEENIKQEDQGVSTTVFSFHKIPQVNSPSSNNSPNSNNSTNLNITSLSFIQDQHFDSSNQKTLKLDQQSSTMTEKIYISNEQNKYNNSDSDSENRKIIQTYQKISKININKNIIKAFKKFMLDKENQEIVSSFGFANEQKSECKIMKIFFDSLNHNNQSVTKIIDHPVYGGIFEFFLTFYAEQWLQESRVQDKEAHFVAIDFFKLCCTENKVKLSNFKYYSKRKIGSNKNSTKKQSQSSNCNQICSEQQQSFQRSESCSNDIENNYSFEDISNTHQEYKSENMN